MTISTTESTAVFDGNGATTVFPFTFPFIQDSDLKVYQKVVATGVITELVAGFTKAGAGSASGGSVTFSVAPATGIKIIVSREVDLTQSTDLRNQGSFFPEVHEDAFDRLTMQIQQVAEQVDRSVKVDIAADTNPDDMIASISAAANAAEQSATDAQVSADAADSSADSAAASAAASSGSALDAAASAASVAGANINTTRIDIASAATVNLTTGAPNTRHINITGTTGITAFTVAAGQCYFVRFNAALTLTNNANIVTQTGANITTAAGDTCILRATAANVVEVLSFKSGTTQKNECTAWVNFNGTGTVAIRDSFNVSSITDNGTGDYTVNFAVAMANSNYSVVDGVGPNNGSSPEGVIIGAGPSAATDVPPTINGFRVLNIVSASAAFDITRLMFQVFGGK